MKRLFFLIGSLLVVFTSVSLSSASFVERETDGNLIKLGSRKIIRQMKRIDSAKGCVVESQMTAKNAGFGMRGVVL